MSTLYYRISINVLKIYYLIIIFIVIFFRSVKNHENMSLNSNCKAWSWIRLEKVSLYNFFF